MNHDHDPSAVIQTICHADPLALWRDAESWNAIAGGVPFRTTDWLQPWWENLADGCRANVIVVRRGGELIGALPLCRPARSRTWQTMAGGRTCTDYVSVLCRREHREVVTTAVANHLASSANDSPTRWHRLRLDGVVSGDETVGLLLEKLQARGCGVDLSSQVSTWVNVCEPTWDAFVTSRNKKNRYLLRSSLRLAQKHPDLTYHVPCSDAEVRRACGETIDLHQARWNESGEPGSFGDPAARAMIEHAVQRMHAAGRLHLATLRLGERLVAGAIHFSGDDGRLYCYCTGVDHGCEFAAGTALGAFVLHHAHQIGSPAVDLMRGDEVYKDRLQCHPSPVLRITVSAPNIAGRARRIADRAVFKIRQRIRSTRNRLAWRTPTLGEAFGPEHRWLLPQSAVTLTWRPVAAAW